MKVIFHQFRARLRARFVRLLTYYHPRTWIERGLRWTISLAIITAILALSVLGIIWSREPALFNVRDAAAAITGKSADKLVTGEVTTAALIAVASTLLDKRGGYLSNDIAPPGVFLDNMPNWEYGVLVQVRDMARALRNDLSRSQSQSLEDKDLAEAEPHFNFDNDAWLFPPSEGKYRSGIDAVQRYLDRLATNNQRGTQFYARADNLRDWLAIVEKRLGSLSQRLSASVGKVRINTNLAGDSAATRSTPEPGLMMIKTPWMEIDDVFFETRGTAWALIHFLHAIEIDFAEVLQKKNALASLRQIIRELEATQEPVWSPIILNGSGFGFVNNHSLVMANYISRANAAVIDLRSLLEQG